MAIKIMNMRTDGYPSKPWQVRVDRKSILGNPFGLTRVDHRDKVCDLYAARFKVATHTYHYGAKELYNLTYDDVQAINLELLRLINLHKEHGQLELYCWCTPLRCHAETIKEHLDEAIKMFDHIVGEPC